MGATDLEKLWLLTWKNFLQQWRHKLQSTAEVLLPVLTASLILILRHQLEPSLHYEKHWPGLDPYSLQYSRDIMSAMDTQNLYLAYSPNSPILETTVQTAFAKLVARNIELFVPGNVPPSSLPPQTIEAMIIQRGLAKVKGYKSSSDMKGLYLNSTATKQALAAVQFEDALYGATALPENVNYSLRFPARPRLNLFFRQGSTTWRTDSVFPAFPFPGPRFPWSFEGGNAPGYYNEMFIALQHAISMQLIATLAPYASDVPEVFVQRYPHPPYINDYLANTLHYLFPMLIMLSFTYTAVSTTRFVGREKELQLKESMKIMGLPTWLHWTAWFIKQFLFLLITIAMMIVIFKLKWQSAMDEGRMMMYSVFTYTPWDVLTLFLCLYVACTIFFAFMLSGLFEKASTAALFCSVFWFLSYLPSLFLTTDNVSPFSVQLIACLSLNSAMALGFQQLLTHEVTGRGMQWSDFFQPLSGDDNFLFGHVCLMLVLDCVIYMLLALYIEKVFPGSFGVPLKWYYLVLPSYWNPSRDVDNYDKISKPENDDIVSDSEPKDLKKGVKIQGLTKVFEGNQIAVNNLNLTIYNDQITVLLGHNGAGKTTTISMLTGLLQPTRGTAILAGHNISTHLSAARNSLGICPQHNVLFTELTVREHLIFFSRLKGLRGEHMEKDVNNVIKKLELEAKADTHASKLSGGQQRRLCVGVALCGAPKVVLLDEPTSGMDPSSRRALWDLLQQEKQERAIILTTHFMDEADILGDRIAIMSGGRLQCVGSPFFLKQHYGSGYKLVVVKDENCNVPKLTHLLQGHIPEVKLLSDRGSELSYSVPTEKLSQYQRMLLDLEKNFQQLGVKSYGLVPTSLEDVFMIVGSDSVDKVSEDCSNSESYTSFCESMECTEQCRQRAIYESTEPISSELDKPVRGLRLFCNHILAIWMKRGLATFRDWRMSLMQLVIPILLSATTIVVVTFTSQMASSSPPRYLSLTDGYIRTETFVSQTSDCHPLLQNTSLVYKKWFRSLYLTITDIGNQDMSEYYLSRAPDTVHMSLMRDRNVIGATFGPALNATAWFSNFGFHDIAITLASFHSALLKALVPTASLDVYNHPLPVRVGTEEDASILQTILSMQLANSMGTTMAIISSFYVIFYIKERVSRAKLLQKSSGVQPVVLWGAAAIFDWFWFLIVNLEVIVVFAAFRVRGISSAEQLGLSYLIMGVFAASVLPVQYFSSFLFTGAASGFVLSYFVHTLLGNIGSSIVDALRTEHLKTHAVGDGMHAVLQFFPTYSMVSAFRDLTKLGLTEAACYDLCPLLDIDPCTSENICSSGVPTCCMNERYYQWESPGLGYHLLTMICSMLLFWAIIMLLEYRVFDKIRHWRKCKPPPLDLSTEDEDVAAEHHAVDNILDQDRANYNLLCRGLSKCYGRKNIPAVNQISFSVKSAECFGLLGVNGAGKTSTFKMLTGDVSVSAGNAWVRGYSVRYQIKDVHQNIGYCPQFDALFEELTGRETLRLYALFRGLRTKETRQLTRELAARLGFLRHIDKKVKQYSGGNRRKLSTALALMGYASLIYLDEPTTGVDPASKRQVWSAIQHSTDSGRSVVLTSHSMEECEALCTRLAIMVNGRFRCFGSTQHLKNKFSQGYTLTAKLVRQDTSKQTGTTEAVNINEATRQYITANFFGAKLMESYQGLVTYYLPDRTTPWSHMFGLMEAIRGTHVEDYLISQTTLEQVFLQFTKYQQDPVK